MSPAVFAPVEARPSDFSTSGITEFVRSKGRETLQLLLKVPQTPEYNAKDIRYYTTLLLTTSDRCGEGKDAVLAREKV